MTTSTDTDDLHDEDFGGCSLEELQYYERMASALRPAGMELDVRFGEEGPSHDPYGWTTYDVKLVDGTRTMYRDSEFTESLDIWYPDGTHIKFSAPEYSNEPPMELMFKEIVGFGFEQLRFWANEDYERHSDVREAEMLAGWDPNP